MILGVSTGVVPEAMRHVIWVHSQALLSSHGQKVAAPIDPLGTVPIATGTWCNVLLSSPTFPRGVTSTSLSLSILECAMAPFTEEDSPSVKFQCRGFSL